MPDSSASIARLKRRIDALSRSAQGPAAGQVTPNHSTLGQFTLGLSAIDARLGGGLARKGLHEVVAMAGDHPAASGFALMLAARAVVGDAPILVVSVDRYLREQGGLYAPGLIDLGLDPDRIMLVHAPDEMAALKVAADSLNCAAGRVILPVRPAPAGPWRRPPQPHCPATHRGRLCCALNCCATGAALPRFT
jgi:protein ImuA